MHPFPKVVVARRYYPEVRRPGGEKKIEKLRERERKREKLRERERKREKERERERKREREREKEEENKQTKVLLYRHNLHKYHIYPLFI